VNKLFVSVIALAMLTGNIAAAKGLKRSSVDQYSIKGIKIGMSVAEVKEILPELLVLSTPTGEDYFVLNTQRPSKVKKGYLRSQYEGTFFRDQLVRIKTSEAYDKLDCQQVRDKLHDKYGRRAFIRKSGGNYKGFPKKYIVEVKMEDRTQTFYDTVKGNLPSKFKVVYIQDGNEDFHFSHKITCYEIKRGVLMYGEGSVNGVLESNTLKDEVLLKESREKEAKRKLQREQELIKRKDIDADEINL
jgi:hypothetical protein